MITDASLRALKFSIIIYISINLKASIVWPIWHFKHWIQVSKKMRHLWLKLNRWFILQVSWVTEPVKADVWLAFIQKVPLFPLPLRDFVTLLKGYCYALTKWLLRFLELRNIIMAPGLKTFFAALSMHKMFKNLLIKACSDFSNGRYVRANVAPLVSFCFSSLLTLVNASFLFCFELNVQNRLSCGTIISYCPDVFQYFFYMSIS